MAYTNGFKLYDENNLNVIDDAQYASNSQRLSGAIAGQKISSSLMNTTLRMLSSIDVALIDALISNSGRGSGELNLATSQADLVTAFNRLLTGLNVSYSDSTNKLKTDGQYDASGLSEIDLSYIETIRPNKTIIIKSDIGQSNPGTRIVAADGMYLVTANISFADSYPERLSSTYKVTGIINLSGTVLIDYSYCVLGANNPVTYGTDVFVVYVIRRNNQSFLRFGKINGDRSADVSPYPTTLALKRICDSVN